MEISILFLIIIGIIIFCEDPLIWIIAVIVIASISNNNAESKEMIKAPIEQTETLE